MKNSLHSSGRSLILAILLLASAQMTNSCTKDSNNPYSSNGNNSYGDTGNPNEVIMQGMAFTPSSLTVAAGTKVTWRNNDSMAHTVTSDNALFDSGNIGAGGTYTYTFSTAGTFAYHCAIHSMMTGTITVK